MLWGFIFLASPYQWVLPRSSRHFCAAAAHLVEVIYIQKNMHYSQKADSTCDKAAALDLLIVFSWIEPVWKDWKVGNRPIEYWFCQYRARAHARAPGPSVFGIQTFEWYMRFSSFSTGSFFWNKPEKNTKLLRDAQGLTDWRGTRLGGRKPFKSDEYSTGRVEDFPLAAKNTLNFRSVSVPLLKKVVLKAGERRFAHLKVLWKVTFSKGCYLFCEDAADRMWPGSKTADIWKRMTLSPLTRVWVTGRFEAWRRKNASSA